MTDINDFDQENKSNELLLALILALQNQENQINIEQINQLDFSLLRTKRKKISDDNIVVPKAHKTHSSEVTDDVSNLLLQLNTISNEMNIKEMLRTGTVNQFLIKSFNNGFNNGNNNALFNLYNFNINPIHISNYNNNIHSNINMNNSHFDKDNYNFNEKESENEYSKIKYNSECNINHEQTKENFDNIDLIDININTIINNHLIQKKVDNSENTYENDNDNLYEPSLTSGVIVNSQKKGNPINKIVNLLNNSQSLKVNQKEIFLDLLKDSQSKDEKSYMSNSKKPYFISKKEERGIKTKKFCCSCNKSHCLKLYCECLKKFQYCTSCACESCFNSAKFEAIRQTSINHLKNKSKIAFKKRVEFDVEGNQVKHIKGCKCKNSKCQKGYCECHQYGAKCTELCRCRDCFNI